MKYWFSFFLVIFSYCAYSQLYGWDSNAYLPGLGRDDAVCFTLDEIVFIGTGNHGGFAESNMFYAFNTRNKKWQEVASFPGAARQYALAEEVGFKAYLIGGIDLFGNPLKDVWEYDFGTDTWKQMSDFPGAARWKATSFKIGSIIYYGTGKDWNRSFNDFWKYDPQTDIWKELDTIPFLPRNESVAFAIYKDGYLGLGEDCTGVLKADIWKFNTESEAWTYETEFPGGPRYYAAAEVLNGHAYVGTGEDETGVYYNDFWEYNPATKVWKQAESVPNPPRRGVAACAIPFKGIYFACGLDNNFSRLTDISRYTNRNLNPPGITTQYQRDEHRIYVYDLPSYSVIRVVDITGKIMFETYEFLDHVSVETHNWTAGVYVVWIGQEAVKISVY